MIRNNNSQVKISVIINCFNGEKYLHETLISLIAQTYSNYEVIFWDNQSTDSSAKVYLSYEDNRFKYFLAEQHTSLSTARNLAVTKCSGDWIAFLDCDDLWKNDKLEKQVYLIERNKDAGLIYGQINTFSSNKYFNKSESKWSRKMLKYNSKTLLKKLPEGNIFDKLLLINFIPITSTLVRKEYLIQNNGMSSNLNIAEDYELFLNITKMSSAYAVQEVVAYYRIHENNLSISSFKKGYEECHLILEKYKDNKNATLGLNILNFKYSIWLINSKNFINNFKFILSSIRVNVIIILLKIKFSRII